MIYQAFDREKNVYFGIDFFKGSLICIEDIDFKTSKEGGKGGKGGPSKPGVLPIGD